MGNFIFGGGSKSLNKGGLLTSPALSSSRWFDASGVIQCGVVINNCDEVIPCL